MAGWTTPRTWVAGELLTASLLNTHLRDNLVQSRVIRGTVASGGTVTDGEGFSPVKVGTGVYEISLAAAFETNVHVIAVALTSSARMCVVQQSSPLTSKFSVSIFDSAGAAVDSPFKFTAANATDLA